MFVVPDAELHGSSSRGSRIVISRSEFSLRCDVRLLFVVLRRGDYISGTANTRVLIKLLFGFYGFYRPSAFTG